MIDVDVGPSEDADLPAILAIQNHEIREGVAIWHVRERRLDEIAAWRAERLRAGFPVLAARRAGAVLGYGGFGPFRPFDAYHGTVEHSVYVRPDAQGQGIGRALLKALEREARRRGDRVMIGGVEAGNAASIALHAGLGFQETARMPGVAEKFGRPLTLVLLQKALR